MPPRKKQKTAKAKKTLKLYYFDIPGKGEPIRLACAVNGIDLEDIRISYEDFNKMKEEGKLPFGQLPCLEVEGKKGESAYLVQSAAIMRYIGKLVGGDMYPSDAVKAALVDAVVDQEIDLFMGLTVSKYHQRFGFGILDDKSLMEKVRKQLNDEVLPRLLASLEALMKASSTGWIAGGKGPSIADFILAPRLTWLAKSGMEGISPEILQPYPLLRGLIDKLLALPEVVEYYETHKPIV
eukprot:g80883.t1